MKKVKVIYSDVRLEFNDLKVMKQFRTELREPCRHLYCKVLIGDIPKGFINAWYSDYSATFAKDSVLPILMKWNKFYERVCCVSS